jgi:hypothetical protein
MSAAASSSSSSGEPPVVEESKSGGKRAHGTHDYPDHLTHIDRLTWDVIVVGAGPAGLMTAVSEREGLCDAVGRGCCSAECAALEWERCSAGAEVECLLCCSRRQLSAETASMQH